MESIIQERQPEGTSNLQYQPLIQEDLVESLRVRLDDLFSSYGFDRAGPRGETSLLANYLSRGIYPTNSAGDERIKMLGAFLIYHGIPHPVSLQRSLQTTDVLSCLSVYHVPILRKIMPDLAIGTLLQLVNHTKEGV